MNFERLTTGGVALVVLLGTGAALSRVARPTARGDGLVRMLAADASWLKANIAWEARDEDRARAWSGAAISARPGSDYFRVNAARMRAFDFPLWRETRAPDAPASVRRRWRAELAEEALALLAAGPAPDAGRLIEAGNIAFHACRDPERAAEFYRRAAELPGAPWHAGRIHAELLRQTGRSREALAWLRAWLPRLPAGDPAAQRERVAARIAELERELAQR